MPTYVYKFLDTGETLEVQQSFADETLTEAVHPRTGATMAVKKVFQPVGVTFKGDGFYKTDSRSSSKTGSGAANKSESSSSDGGSGTSSTAGDGTGAGSDTKKAADTASTTPTTKSSESKSTESKSTGGSSTTPSGSG